MNTLIIYHSFHHQNTEKVVSAMASILKARLATLDQIKPDKIDKYDLIGFGSGIYFGRHHKSLLKLAESLPRAEKKSFIFSTAGLPQLKYFNHRSLRIALKKKGFKIVGEFCCPGWDTYPKIVRPFGGINKGRPNEVDLKKAQNFAKSLQSRFLI